MKRNEKKIRLTKKELEALMYITEGLNNAEIADKMYVSIHTVKFYIKNIFQKLNAKNRVNAVIKAVKYGLVEI